MKLNRLLWGAFGVFVAGAWYFDRHPAVANGAPAFGRYVVWTLFAGFLAYTIWCSSRENLFNSIGQLATLHWGRQVGIDLYLGLALMLCAVFLHEESAVVALMWLLPVLAFGNLATLLYIALHYDGLLARFAG